MIPDNTPVKKQNGMSPAPLCFLALAAVINLVGGTLALVLRLPIYLDSIGTILTGALLGPVYGMLPGLISGLISGFTSDIYALYYIPVQLLTGLLSGLVFSHFRKTDKTWAVSKTKREKATAIGTDKGIEKKRTSPAFLLSASALISLPGTFISSAVTAVLFGGITSSGSTILVQLLNHTGLSMTASVCIVQALTDYADRAISLALTLFILAALPASFKAALQKGSPIRTQKGA